MRHERRHKRLAGVWRDREVVSHSHAATAHGVRERAGVVAASRAARHSTKSGHRVGRRGERNLQDEGAEEGGGRERTLHQASKTLHPEDECGNPRPLAAVAAGALTEV